ncbi:MAG: hypothetical protein A2Z18_04965 [Armatimonadetes bacterium RBG_16_58_9]|nr:MAG: hypothetical protein A2Z18_04965 [Armatimonadetes bacterium RBG_16_58_9]
MPDRINVEELIQRHSAGMAERMNEIAQWANTEEDVRHEVNKLIDSFCAEAGIEARGRHEYGLAGGRIDSKYGGVIIEYKYPKGPGGITLQRDAPGTVAVVQKIRQRFKDFQKDEHIEPDRLFAVGCDGRTLVYVRHRGGRFEVEDPQPVTSHTVGRLLRALVSLGARGQSFTPDHLAAQFGADSPMAQQGLRDIYAVIKDTTDKKAKTFFGQWKIMFSEVCGYDVEGRNEKIKQLGSHYGLRNAKPAELLFSLHTYYAIFMKFLAAEIAGSFSPLGVSVVKRCVNAATSDKLRREMENLEQGGIWNDLGITNFLEGDLFSWYLSAWEDKMAKAVWNIVRKLDEFDPTTLSVDPTESRDLLKKLYQHLFPKSVRHDLGEYYTPDWLAEHVLNETEYSGDPDKRVLDPACGSGTFLVAVVNRIKEWFTQNRDQCGYGEEELVQKILKNVVGFDLNPLAVMAARTNYLLAIRDLLRFAGRVEVPVYLCDSVMTPAGYTVNGYKFTHHQIKTAVDTFNIPPEVVDAELIGRYAETIERCVRNRYTAEEFTVRCTEEGLPIKKDRVHRQLYEKLLKLDAKNQNGIWARIIKNAFAPLFVARVDYLVGNPPWVNWESLPDHYRASTLPMWERYGLRSEKGQLERMRAGKRDLAMLFVYAGVDNYLVDNGRIGFVITQTVFKTAGAGDGFRRMRYKCDNQTVVIKPHVVHDLSATQVFEAATNRTAVFVGDRQTEDFLYPVRYIIWNGPSRIDQDCTLDAVLTTTSRREVGACPIEPDEDTSPWLTAPTTALTGIHKVIGSSHYEAHEGVNTGGLNGAYWVRVRQKLPSGLLLIENLHDVGKRKVEHVTTSVEPDLVYPLLRGRDVGRWKATPSCHIVAPQDPVRQREGILEKTMKTRYPNTYEYLRGFRDELAGRKDMQYYPHGAPFYTMRNVADYTRSPWKVVWPEVGNSVRAAVCGSFPVGNGAPVFPDHTIVAVSCDSREEAHYISALLNSAPAQLAISGYIVLHPSPHVLDHIAIPQYSTTNQSHVRLAELSEMAHGAASDHRLETLRQIENDVDRVAAELWQITNDELAAIQAALREQKRPRGGQRRSDNLSLGLNDETE